MTCGGGQKIATRMMINPALYGGKSCEGDGFITEKCNEQPCPGKILLKCKWCLFKLALYEIRRTSANNSNDYFFQLIVSGHLGVIGLNVQSLVEEESKNQEEWSFKSPWTEEKSVLEMIQNL